MQIVLTIDKQKSLSFIFYLSKVTCGAELALLFVETLVKGKIPYDDGTLGAFLSFLLPFNYLSVVYFLSL